MKPQINPRKRSGLVSKKGTNRWMKVVRRIHLYTGLILLPWVVFFGFSGVLFNHSEWFSPVEKVSKISAREVGRIHPFELPDPDAIADEVISSLNQGKTGSTFERISRSDATLDGALVYQAPTKEGNAQVKISLNHGSAEVVFNPGTPKLTPPPFQGKKIAVPSFAADFVSPLADAVLEKSELNPTGTLVLSERGGPEVRFQIHSSGDGKTWNAVYNLVSGTINARDIEETPVVDANAILGRLHKAHHYPDRMGARWLWSLFGDATGFTMVFWGLSGVIMWWQMKPTRALGVMGLSVAAVLSLVIFSGTFADLTFGPPQQRVAPQNPEMLPTGPRSGGRGEPAGLPGGGNSAMPERSRPDQSKG